MNADQIAQRLRQYHDRGARMFVSSSFQTHSIPLLHIISLTRIPIDVVFINTGFHFPETLTFKNSIAALLDLNVIDVGSSVSKHDQRDLEGNFHFISDPDYCCFLNKVEPLDKMLGHYDVWISGVRSQQSVARKNMKIEQEAPYETMRFHPLLDWTSKDIYTYRKQHDLPAHPLDDHGYLSVGCAPCTRKLDLHNDRSGRWYGLNKTECGLHKDLIK